MNNGKHLPVMVVARCETEAPIVPFTWINGLCKMRNAIQHILNQ